MKKRIFLAVVVVAVIAVFFSPGKNLLAMESSQVESIRLAGWTGGQDGDYEHILSPDEREAFIELLQTVRLGRRVSESQAQSAGAVTYYTITFVDGEELRISPDLYFMVDGKYYVFKNQDELWDEFVDFNSLGL